MRRVVFDASVWVSAVAFPRGVPFEAIGQARARLVRSVTSPALIDQVRRALLGPKFALPLATVEQTEAEMRDRSLLIHPTVRLAVITAKESDNRVLECAVEGGADLIVTGDRKHLLRLGAYRGIAIVSPRDFLIGEGMPDVP